MNKIALTIFLGAGILFTLASSKAAESNDILYKGTKFGATEKTFTHQHQNEGFVCADAPNGNPGRWCESEVATYLNFKTHTTAQFLDNRLLLVSVFFKSPSDVVSSVVMDDAIVSQIEHRYGAPNETEWPKEVNGGKIWKKVWHSKDGSSIEYLHYISTTGPLNLDERNVFIMSKDADKLTRAPSAQKSDM
ncbi:hypothetical protein [Burkholderia ubonensis]|uniref:hypothetical protein n=1 Tax=Burkholderia ubonensis TaxID=101571 RepID=UPI000F59BF6F|nr:hypothetical protein [Burkholderia ubonensis]